jgi:flagellar basal body-associated protein FliL
MADEKAMEQPAEQEAPKSSKKKTMILGGGLIGVMVVEAVVVFVLVKHFGASPAAAEAMPPVHGVTGEAEPEHKPEVVELDVVKLRAQNERAQRQITYDLDVYVSVSDANKEKVGKVLQGRKATVQDRLARVVRAAEPERFIEPDLRTLRKQFLVELTQIVGEEGLIVEVLIPSIVSSEN